MPPDLADWQRRLAIAVGGGGMDGLPEAAIIHRQNAREALQRALAATFPVTRRLVGGDCFAALGDDYVFNHPPASPVLAEYGADFPAFLAGHLIVENLPYLADMSRFEWLRGEAGQAGDAAALPLDAWQALTPAVLLESRLDFHPSLGLFASKHPVGAIWRIHQHPEGVPPGWQPETSATHSLMHRHKNSVECIDVCENLLRIIAMLQGGHPVGEALARNDPSDEDTAALIGLLRQGLVVGLRTKD